MDKNSNFIELQFSKKIWAIGSIHSNIDSFESIKDHILKSFSNGDKLIFLGNIIGIQKNTKETLSSVISMRNYLLSKFLLKPDDIIFLRGAQEEMFLKLLQLQTAPNPYDIVKWIFEHGVDKTVESYGFNKEFCRNLSLGANGSDLMVLIRPGTHFIVNLTGYPEESSLGGRELIL